MEELLSPKELAIHVGWPVRRIRNLISSNLIRHIRIGGNIFAPKDAINEYIQTNMVEPCLDPAQDRASSSASKNRLFVFFGGWKHGHHVDLS